MLLLDELLLEGNTKVKNQVERSINQTLNAIDECCDISFGYGMTGVMYLLALTKQYSYISYDLSQIFEYLDRSTVRQLSEFNGNYDLLHGKKVTDIAFKYGYQSMDGFTRAFKKLVWFLTLRDFKEEGT